MSDLYQTNRKLVESYRQQLQQKLVSLHQAGQSPSDSEIDPQKFYLDFKDRAIHLVEKETALLQKECAKSDNCHLLLLKQTALVDTLVQASFYSAVWYFNHQNNQEWTTQSVPIAIVARGGYGREEMYFRSDVDIQIVSQSSLSEEDKKIAEAIIRHFEYLFIFQDIFPASSNSCYTENETFERDLDPDKVSEFMALLEHRFVAGNSLVYGEFKSSIKTVSLLYRDEIQKHCLSHEGCYEVQNTVFQQEPNIKEEMRRPYWALVSVRFLQNLSTTNQFELLTELFAKNLLSPLAYKSMQNGLHLLSRTRLFLHTFQKGTHRDTMSYEVREKIAQSMGFDVKTFFQKYFFDAVYPLKRFSRNLYWESMAVDTKKIKNLSEYFSLNTQQQIYFEKSPENLFAQEPLWLFKVFIWVAERNYYLSYEVTRAIEQHVDQAYPIFMDEESKLEIQSCFKRIIRGKFFSKAIRLLHEFGILGDYFIPEFNDLKGILQDVYVHKFPTDIHILSALDVLNGLEFRDTADPFLSELYHSQRDKTALKLAVLLHDIGKGAKVGDQNEELVGAKMIPQILNNLGYNDKPKRVDDVSFLVEKHLTMYDLMLLDPEADDTYDMVLDLVDHDKEKLKMLVLLTHADRGGTKMDLSSSQIEQLKLFYQYTLHHKKRKNVPNHIKLEFLNMVRLPRELQSQLEIYYRFVQSQEPFMAEMLFMPGQPSELVVCTQDVRGFLHKVSAVLAFNQLDIVEANIQTFRDKVFDVFKVIDSKGKPIDYGDFFFIQQRIHEDLRRIFIDQEPLESIFKGKTIGGVSETPHFQEIKFKMKTIGRSVKLSTHNLPGTFMMETKVFADSNMECQKAVLHTHQGTASNVFYLRPEDVEKIMNNPEHFIQTFKKSLQPLLTGEPLFLQEELEPNS
ncbi:MAG: HD domain-containing protein [Nitrospina sp.]|jgi:[protein-PII] uridylyltransferase|nr:HD domain-containing protein [Nitrospina sp.]